MTDDLTAFLRARLDDDEQVARAAIGTEGETRSWTELITAEAIREQEHNDRHDPVRVLAEVDAKRLIIDRYERAMENRRAHPDDLASAGALLALHEAVKLLALPYRDHPDYRPEWAPEA